MKMARESKKAPLSLLSGMNWALNWVTQTASATLVGVMNVHPV